MFLSVMSRVRGRKDDNLLKTYGFRGFPSFAALDATGKMLAKPRGRSLAAFETLMEQAAGLDKNSRKVAGRQLDVDKISADFLRRVKKGTLRSPKAERAVFVSCRETLSEAQRRTAKRALALHQLHYASEAASAATLGSRASDLAMLDLLIAKVKLGDWPSSDKAIRPLVHLMRWAEFRKDPQMFETMFEEFEPRQRSQDTDARQNQAAIRKWKNRLEACQRGEPRPKRSSSQGR